MTHSSVIPSHSNSRKVTDFLTLAARFMFAATIIFIPARARIILLARPNPPVYGDYTDFMLFIPDLFMLASILFWGLSLIITPRQITKGPAHIWVSLVGLVLAGWLSFTSSWDPSLTIYHAMRLSLLFLFFLFIVNEIHSPAWVVIPVGIQVLIQSVVAIGQSLLQRDLGLQILGEYRLDPLRSGVSVLESGNMRFLRAYGLSDHPNILGGCLAFGLVILLAAFIQQEKWTGLTALVFVPAAVGLFLTFSRSAWVAFFTGSLLIVGIEMVQRNTKAIKRTLILALICFSAMLPFAIRDLPYLGGRLDAGNSFTDNRVEHGSIIEREYLFDAANRIFVDHALTGVGLGASAVAFKINYPDFPMNYQPPHFTLLAAALETGIIGVTFYFILLIGPLFVLVIRRRQFLMNKSLIACGATLLAIAVVGLFDYYTWGYVTGQLWQWLAWGVWASALENHRYAID